MLTEELQVGNQVIYNAYAVSLTSKVGDINRYAYWWCETLFQDPPEKLMMAFPHGAVIKKLHTQRSVSAT